MNKKIFTDVLFIFLAFALFVMWYEGKFEHREVTTTPAQNFTVYLITMHKSSDYWFIMNHGASDMADLLGVTYKWDAPIVRNVDEQIDIIKNAVSAGADALMIAASDPERLSGVIEDAKKAGVKIIYVDAPANAEGIVTLSTDNYAAGITAGETMIFELKAIGIKAGTIGIVSLPQETITTMNREKGFRDAIKKDGEYTILDTRYTTGDITMTQEAAEAFIKENPNLVGLFGTSETTTIGVGNAIKASNKNIVGIGFDITKTIQEMIDAGYIKAVMVQNPYTMGYLGMAEAFAALNGYNTGPPFLNTGVKVRTQYSH